MWFGSFKISPPSIHTKFSLLKIHLITLLCAKLLNPKGAREFGERSLGCQGHQSVPLILSLGTLRPPDSGSPVRLEPSVRAKADHCSKISNLARLMMTLCIG